MAFDENFERDLREFFTVGRSHFGLKAIICNLLMASSFFLDCRQKYQMTQKPYASDKTAYNPSLQTSKFFVAITRLESVISLQPSTEQS